MYWEGIPEGTRSCFGIERLPKRGGWDRRRIQCTDEGSVEGEPALTRLEEDRLVRVPSEMDLVSIGPLWIPFVGNGA